MYDVYSIEDITVANGAVVDSSLFKVASFVFKEDAFMFADIKQEEDGLLRFVVDEVSNQKNKRMECKYCLE